MTNDVQCNSNQYVIIIKSYALGYTRPYAKAFMHRSVVRTTQRGKMKQLKT